MASHGCKRPSVMDHYGSTRYLVWHRNDLFTAKRFVGYNSKSTTMPRSSGGISLDGQISTSEFHEAVCLRRPENHTDTKKGANMEYGNAHGVADM
ncbi:hypothetical protein SCLCIDRAFT_471928 [Scleroderma citrinum Foug A]|uniref:Uncharacterized protein n=1 Tax=Scleroderma citrinum Foug A TaxID=1036808 RepID=A0A0C2ZVJ6_9AGAM|nr:hypothetical protein SCLCIDRAFT_471928 [Scleroderma citrinum Foug A]